MRREAAFPALALLAVVVAVGAAAVPPAFPDLVRHFDYNPRLPLDLKETAVEDRAGVKVHDLSYASPLGGRVPAYLVVPPGRGPFAAILFGHWTRRGSPLRGRKEFLDEAVVLARSGAVSLLIDAPYVRPGFVLERELMRAAEQSARVEQQEVVDLRRGTDLLLARPDVDPKRIAYVGHSFGAHAGALLAGVDKRIQSFVLMAGSYADQENAFALNTPEMQQVRAQMGEDRLRQFFSQHSWDDPVYYAPHSAPAAVFLQFASKDQSDDRARQYYERFGNPKQMKIYMAAHALNAAARVDRVEWLARRLSLRAVDRTALEKIPPL